MPKITVAIPTYNRPEFLAQSIKSILGQSFKDFRIIIFDDGSSFSYEEFLKQFNDDRIEVLKNEQNSGSNEKNFEKIFKYSYNTEYLVVFHDDDVMHPELLKRQVGIMEADTGVVLAGTNLNFVHNFLKMNNFGQMGSKENFKILTADGVVRELLSGFNLSFASVMYRTDILENIEPYQKEFSKWGDRPFVLALAKKGKAALLFDKLVNYRIHPGQDSQSSTADELVFIFKLFDFYKNSLPQPLSLSDSKLFKSWATNNAILSASSFAKDFSEYIKVLKIFKQKGFFYFKYIKLRGLWYLLKVVKKLL